MVELFLKLSVDKNKLMDETRTNQNRWYDIPLREALVDAHADEELKQWQWDILSRLFGSKMGSDNPDPPGILPTSELE